MKVSTPGINSCKIVQKTSAFLKISSVLVESVREMLYDEYDVVSLFDDDIDAIFSRIQFKQNHEAQMRETW